MANECDDCDLSSEVVMLCCIMEEEEEEGKKEEEGDGFSLQQKELDEAGGSDDRASAA